MSLSELYRRLRATNRGWKIAVWIAAVTALATAYYWPTLRWPLVYRGEGGLRATGSLEPGDALPIVRDAIIDGALGWRGVRRWFTERMGRGPYGLDPGDSLTRADTLRIVRRATRDDQLGEVRHREWFDQHFALRGSVYYRPMVMFSSWLDIRLFGTWSVGHRVHSLLLHIGCCLLLGFVVSAMAGNRWPGALAGLAFAIWPDTDVVVTWIAARCELLPAIFGLAALALLLRIGPQGERARWLWPLSLLAFLLALGSKEAAFALPLLLAIWMLLWPVRLRPATRALIVLSFVVVAAAFMLVRRHALGSEPQSFPPLGELLSYHVLRHFAAFMARPLVFLVLGPNPLRLDVWVLFDVSAWKFVGRVALWLGAAALLLIRCRRSTLAFVAWMAVLFLPVLPTAVFWAWPHRYYWPSMGQAALFGLALWQGALLASRCWPAVWSRLKQIEWRPT